MSNQLTPTIKQSILDELPNTGKGNLSSKNKYVLSDYNKPAMKFR